MSTEMDSWKVEKWDIIKIILCRYPDGLPNDPEAETEAIEEAKEILRAMKRSRIDKDDEQ